jgi:hypothetical protein
MSSRRNDTGRRALFALLTADGPVGEATRAGAKADLQALLDSYDGDVTTAAVALGLNQAQPLKPLIERLGLMEWLADRAKRPTAKKEP